MMQFDSALPAAAGQKKIHALCAGQDAAFFAHVATQLAQQQSQQGYSRAPLVIFSENAFTAQRLLEEISWFNSDLKVHCFPDWETLPYDHFSPHPDLISERLATLYQIHRQYADVVIAPIATVLVKLPPVAYLSARSFMLKKGQTLDLEGLRQQCSEAGYHHVTQVISPGEFSVRGGLIDLFPMGSALPYRIDLFDDEIESLRTFDVDTQRSLYPVAEIRLLPAREFPLDDAGIATFRQNYREIFEGDPSRSRIYKDISKGVASGGIEWYLPLFFQQTASLLDYLPKHSVLCMHGTPQLAAEQFWQIV
jgi:transcription-repair coupling factor (superfamily II helicase)